MLPHVGAQELLQPRYRCNLSRWMRRQHECLHLLLLLLLLLKLLKLQLLLLLLPRWRWQGEDGDGGDALFWCGVWLWGFFGKVRNVRQASLISHVIFSQTASCCENAAKCENYKCHVISNAQRFAQPPLCGWCREQTCTIVEREKPGSCPAPSSTSSTTQSNRRPIHCTPPNYHLPLPPLLSIPIPANKPHLQSFHTTENTW